MVAPVGAIDPLDHLLAPLVLEIDVDVGRLLALGRDEALEQQVQPRRVDGGDVQGVADGRVGGAAAPLAEDLLAARVEHDVVDGQEVGGVAQLADQRELAPDQLVDLLRHPVRIAFACARPGAAGQLLVRRAAIVAVAGRVVVGQLAQREAAALDDLQRALERIRMVPEQARHLVRRFEVALGIGVQERRRVPDPHMLADAGEHVLQRPPVGVVVVDIVGRERPDPGVAREARELGEAGGIVAGIAMGQGEIQAAPPMPVQAGRQPSEIGIGRLGREQREQLPLVVGEHVLQRQRAMALGRQPLAVGQQRAEPRIGRPVGRPAQQGSAVDQIEAAADQEAQTTGLGLLMRADDAGQAVAVGERQARETQRLRLHDQLLGMRGAAQEAEVGGGLQLGVGGHAASAASSGGAEIDEEPVDVGEKIRERGEPAVRELRMERLVPGDESGAEQIHARDIEAIVDRVVELLGQAQCGIEQRLAG